MPIDFEVTMNEYLPLRDVVFNTLRRAILRGELKPGERLMEIQLANKLGVSRTPIREAIRKLELHAAADRFKGRLDSDDITQIAEADEAFHDFIFKATWNDRLIQLLNNLREQMYRYRIEYLKKRECHPQLLKEHATIIKSIEEHDKDSATQITSQHINNQVTTVVGTLKHREE